jgi:hypothetical protein
MRDEYPPFRLDNGGTDPGSSIVVDPVAPIKPPVWPGKKPSQV